MKPTADEQARRDFLIRRTTEPERAAALLRRFLLEITRYHRDLRVWPSPLGSSSWRIRVQARARVLTDAKADAAVLLGEKGCNFKVFSRMVELMGREQELILEFVQPEINPPTPEKSEWIWDEKRIVELTRDLFSEMAGQPVKATAHKADSITAIEVSNCGDVVSRQLLSDNKPFLETLKDLYDLIGRRHHRTVRLVILNQKV